MKKLLLCLCILYLFPLVAWNAHEYLINGTACNNYLLYEEALSHLDMAIQLNPANKQSYEERAITYFELNRIDLALSDYQESRKTNPGGSTKRANRDFWDDYGYGWYDSGQQNFTILSCSLSTASADFATGLLEGISRGGQEGTIEFLSCIRGSCNALWAFACSPVEVSKELINAIYAMGEHLANTDTRSLLEEGLPELVECGRHWNEWSHHTKGKKMGYLIGKYGVSIFFYLGVGKGVSIFSDLKRANMMATLERYSLTKSTKILRESEKCAQKNGSVLKKIQNGCVIPHNANVASHVLQRKHNWHKMVKLTGDKDVDFKLVADFLKKESILNCERIHEFSFNSIRTYRYKKKIGKNTVVAVFETNNQNVPLLRNAWIEVKPPHGH